MSRPILRDGLLALGLIALVFVSRLASEGGVVPPNFAAVGAAALLAGFVMRTRWLALATPLGAMLVSDLYIGTYDWRMMAAVYAAFLLPVAFGMLVRRKNASGWRLAGWVGTGAVGSSLAFFVASNLAHWVFTGMYAKTLGGLIACYGAALPFYKYTLAGDATYTLVLFGAWALALKARGIRADAPAPVV